MPKKEMLQLLTTTKRPNRLLGTRRVAGTVAGIAAGAVEVMGGRSSMVLGTAGAAGPARLGTSRTGVRRAGKAIQDKAAGTRTPTNLFGSLRKTTGKKTAGVTRSGQRHRQTIRRQAGHRKMLHSMHLLLAFTMWRHRPRHRQSPLWQEAPLVAPLVALLVAPLVVPPVARLARRDWDTGSGVGLLFPILSAALHLC